MQSILALQLVFFNYFDYYCTRFFNICTMKNLLLTICLCLLASITFAQQKFTYEYAVKDTNHLKLDVYTPAQPHEMHPCMIFVFGGGFVGGARDDKQIPELMKYYTDKGWVVVAIDYRLGLKGAEHLSVISGIKKFRLAIEMAGEDLISATDYILKHLLQTPNWTINPDHIVTIGSSAGAITVLQADYFLGNRTHNATLLPDTFHYAGVMSFSGLIYSTQGKVKYRVHAPAPTLFCHGTVDQLVPYNKIQIFNQGTFGSNALVKRFEKYDYPYHLRRYEGMGHEVAGYYKYEFKMMDEFIEDYVFGKKRLQIDELYYNPNLKRHSFGSFKIRDLKKL